MIGQFGQISGPGARKKEVDVMPLYKQEVSHQYSCIVYVGNNNGGAVVSPSTSSRGQCHPSPRSFAASLKRDNALESQ